MAFLLVDRIISLDPGRGGQGRFTVPPSAPHLPAALLAEAVGQLASWIAMAEADFRARPVAALAGEVVVSGVAAGGDTLELSAHLEGLERGGVVYGGTAVSDGRTLVSMNRCVGPLLPMEDFDDPVAVRAGFRQLCEEGLQTPGFEPVGSPEFEVLSRDGDERLRVVLQVPLKAAFFADHFPRRPVYPATILLDRKIQMTQRLLQSSGAGWRVHRAMHVKINAFILPGEPLELEAVRTGGSAHEATFQLTGFRDGVRVSRARLEFVRHAT